MVILEDEIEFDLLVAGSAKLILFDFYADWCDPCKWLDQILLSIEPTLKEDFLIVKIDVEKHTTLKDRFNIRGIPVMILFKDGKEVWRMNGFLAERDLLFKLKSFT